MHGKVNEPSLIRFINHVTHIEINVFAVQRNGVRNGVLSKVSELEIDCPELYQLPREHDEPGASFSLVWCYSRSDR